MNARFPHTSGRRASAPGPPHADTAGVSVQAMIGPACCCPANPVVRVVMPATAARPHRTELLLCGHHYRVSRQALAAANATVTELQGPTGNPPDALLPDLPAPRVPVS